MPKPEPKSITEQLRSKVEADGRPLTQIAEAAGVESQPLWRWINRKTEKYDVGSAEKVWKELTGRPFA